MDDFLLQEFIKRLGRYRGELPRNIIKTLKGQALAGDVEGARKGLDKALSKNQSNRDKR